MERDILVIFVCDGEISWGRGKSFKKFHNLIFFLLYSLDMFFEIPAAAAVATTRDKTMQLYHNKNTNCLFELCI